MFISNIWFPRGWLAGWLVGLYRNYWMDFHKTCTESGSRPRADPITFWKQDRSRNVSFSLYLTLRDKTFLAFLFHSQGIMHQSWSGIFRWQVSMNEYQVMLILDLNLSEILNYGKSSCGWYRTIEMTLDKSWLNLWGLSGLLDAIPDFDIR